MTEVLRNEHGEVLHVNQETKVLVEVVKEDHTGITLRNYQGDPNNAWTVDREFFAQAYRPASQEDIPAGPDEGADQVQVETQGDQQDQDAGNEVMGDG